jgi:three-Cys-motif partner protein
MIYFWEKARFVATPGFFSDDGFVVTAAEPWIKEKLQVVQLYLRSFLQHLAGRAGETVLLDLSAGNGLFSLGSSRELFPGTPLVSLASGLPFSKFIFCERDVAQAGVLKVRVNKYFRDRNVLILEGPRSAERIRMFVPQGREHTTGICLVDTFSIDIPFAMLDDLSEMGFSFLVVFTMPLSDELDFSYYLEEEREKLRRFLGGYKDPEKIERDLEGNLQFYKRMVASFQNSMAALGMDSVMTSQKMDSGLMELPQYTIGLFSRQVDCRAVQEGVSNSRHIQFHLFEGG